MMAKTDELNDRPTPTTRWLALKIRRWLPAAALAMAAVGVVLHAAGWTQGALLVVLSAIGVAIAILAKGISEGRRTVPFDERELMQLRAAASLGFGVVAVGTFLLVGFGQWEIWAPRSSGDWFVVGQALFVFWFGTTQLSLGWSARPPEDEES